MKNNLIKEVTKKLIKEQQDLKKLHQNTSCWTKLVSALTEGMQPILTCKFMISRKMMKS